MISVLFIHSAGAQGPDDGSGKLLAALRRELPDGVTLLAPQMPEPQAPEAGAWIEACRNAIADVEGPLVLVGHSLGGSVILQALVAIGPPGTLVGVIVLAAPFWGAPDWEVESFSLPAEAPAALAKVPRLVVMAGDRDEVIAPDHPERYRALLPAAEIRMVPGADHEAASAAPALAAIVAEMRLQAGRG